MENNDICSYELSLALKKAGFDEPCNFYYTKEDAPDGAVWFTGDPRNPQDYNHLQDDCPFAKPRCSAPLLYHAQKWLREKREIFVEVTSEALHDWDFFVMELDEDANVGVVRGSEIYPSYEQALSAGIYAAVLQLLDNQKE